MIGFNSTRRMASMRVLAVCAMGMIVTAGVAVIAEQPPSLKSALPASTRTGPRWEYCTLTEAMLDQKRVAVFIDTRGMRRVCNGGWIEVAEQFGLRLDPTHPRTNDPFDRGMALGQLGDEGWELVGVHRNELNRSVWVFKRPQPSH